MKNIKLAVVCFLAVVIWKEGLKYLTRTSSIEPTGQMIMYFEDKGMQNARVALAQAILETGMFKSKIYKDNYNMFGMKESSRNYDVGSLYGHARYGHKYHSGAHTIKCYDDSILDYIARQKQFGWRGGSDEDYIKFLQTSRYAEDPLYTEKIQFILTII